MAKKYLFETTACLRCSGSGQFGGFGVCFGCGGIGAKLTRKGHKAAGYLQKLRTVKAAELIVGDKVETTGITLGGSLYTYVAEVVAIESSNQTGIGTDGEFKYDFEISLRSAKYGDSRSVVFKSSDFVVRNRDDKAKIALALEYQNTLKGK